MLNKIINISNNDTRLKFIEMIFVKKSFSVEYCDFFLKVSKYWYFNLCVRLIS